METKECIYCHAVIFDYISRNRQFCSHKCHSLWLKGKPSGNDQRTIKQCLFCGSQFKVKKCILKKGKGKYCSHPCANKGKTGIKYPDKSIVRICGICKNEFKVKPYVLKIGHGRFCSSKCRVIYVTSVVSRKIKRTCLQCKKNFLVAPNVVKRGGGKYCSKKCVGRSMRNSKEWGRKSCFWAGGMKLINARIRGIKLYKEWRLKILVRDNFECTICGTKEKSLHVDHYPIPFAKKLSLLKINSVEEARISTELWDINTGRTLCYECHKKTDSYLLPWIQMKELYC